MPSWSPDDSQIAFASSRDEGRSVWSVTLADHTERKLATAAGRADAPSWGPGGQLLYHVTSDGSSRFEIAGETQTGGENVFAFRAAVGIAHDLPLRRGRQNPPPHGRRPRRADRRLLRHAPGHARGRLLRTQGPRLHVDDAAPRARARASQPVTRRHGRSHSQPLATSISSRWTAPGRRSISRTTPPSTPTRHGRPTARSWSTRPIATASTSSSGFVTCAPARAGRSPRWRPSRRAPPGRPTARASCSSTSTACGVSRKCRCWTCAPEPSRRSTTRSRNRAFPRGHLTEHGSLWRKSRRKRAAFAKAPTRC